MEQTPKKSKKKSRKVPEDPETEHTNGLEFNSTGKSKGVKRKIENNALEDEENIRKKAKINKRDDSVLEGLNIKFKERHLATLLDRIEDLLPEADVMPFKNRTKKIDWVQVAFKSYSPKACYTVWNMIQRKLRQKRILKELLCEARGWVNTKWLQNLNPKLHPDFPERPLTSPYKLFFVQAKEHIVKMKPDIEEADINKLAKEAYKTLEPQKVAVYEKAAAANKKRYKAAVRAFYDLHPDLQTDYMEKGKAQSKGPVKPMTPYALYVKDQIEKHGKILDTFVVREACKEEWKTMDDKDKVCWIDRALELEKKYFDEVHKDPSLGKSILSKREWRIKEIMAGKPQKPPTNAYGLFTQKMCKSNALSDILPQEKMGKITSMWKELPEAEKSCYKREAHVLMKNYKIELEKYDQTLKENEDARDSDSSPTKRPANITNGKENDSREETHNSISISRQNDPMEFLDVVIPKSWWNMGEFERSMYIKYIGKIRNYFDEKHQEDEDDDDDDELSEHEEQLSEHGEDQPSEHEEEDSSQHGEGNPSEHEEQLSLNKD